MPPSGTRTINGSRTGHRAGTDQPVGPLVSNRVNANFMQGNRMKLLTLGPILCCDRSGVRDHDYRYGINSLWNVNNPSYCSSFAIPKR